MCQKIRARVQLDHCTIPLYESTWTYSLRSYDSETLQIVASIFQSMSAVRINILTSNPAKRFRFV